MAGGGAIHVSPVGGAVKRRRLVRVLPWVLGVALLVWSIRSVSLEEIIELLRRLRLSQIAVLIAVNAMVLVTINLRWWLLLRGAGYRLPFMTLLGYRLAAFGLSYFTPGPHIGGEPLQVLLVEKEQHVPRSASVAAVALDKAIEFSVNFTFLLLGIAAALQWRIVPRESGQQALGLAVALLGLPLLYLGATALGRYPATRVFVPVARRWPRFSAAADTLAESETQVGRYFHSAPRSFIAAVLVTLVGWVPLIAEYWLMVHFLGTDLTLPQLVTAIVATRIVILLPLPAGLGVLEASQAMTFTALGLDPATGVSAGLLIRVRDTLLGVFGLWWGSHRISSWEQNVKPGEPTPAQQPPSIDK